MKQPAFKRVALLGKINDTGTRHTLEALISALCESQYEVCLEERCATQVQPSSCIDTGSLEKLGQWADIAVVVGGDGNMLGAARALCNHDVAVIGVNRGNLGFLTDLAPEDAVSALMDVLAGDYVREERFLLSASVKGESIKQQGVAVNEIVLHSDKVAHMIEFELYVDDQFVFSQRSDGVIIATPTGSTAYSLSGGGPILHPNLNAITLVPMFPHTLSSRPIVLDANSRVRLRAAKDNDHLQISCDGHGRLDVMPGDEVIIEKHPHTLTMVHPTTHSYYHVLRNKLGWGSRLF